MGMRQDRAWERSGERGFGGLLRGLLDGIPWSDRADDEETVRVPAPTRGALRVQNANARTRVTGEDRSDIEVTAHRTARAESGSAARELLRDIRLVFRESPDGLELAVDVPRKSNRHGSANLSIRAPRELQLSVEAANGRVDIEGMRSPVRARSSNGCAIVSDVVGDVDVSATNAKVCCIGVCGKLSARSSNAKIEIAGHRGAVDASTSNGLIRAEVAQLAEGGIQLATSNGGIVLSLPDPADADVDIRVDNGSIRNDRALVHVARESPGRVVGRLGAGGTPIRLRTSNGSVVIH